MSAARAQFFYGMKDTSPLLIGAAPFGIIYGVLATGAGIPVVMAQAISLIVFAGSAQFIAAQLIGAGASGMVIVLTTFIINLRHALYSASIAPYVKDLPRAWKWVLSYLLTDEAFAVAITHYRDNAADQGRNHIGAGPQRRHQQRDERQRQGEIKRPFVRNFGAEENSDRGARLPCGPKRHAGAEEVPVAVRFAGVVAVVRDRKSVV